MSDKKKPFQKAFQAIRMQEWTIENFHAFSES